MTLGPLFLISLALSLSPNRNGRPQVMRSYVFQMAYLENGPMSSKLVPLPH